MEQTITITSKWQVHIPVKIRQSLGLKSPGLADIKLVNKTIVIKPKESPLLKLAGKYRNLKPTKKINIDRIRDYIDYSRI